MSSVAPVLSGSTDIRSPEHRRLLAEFFIDSHLEFTPEQIRWPSLDEATLSRLAGLPFWQEAVSTEAMTSRTVAAAATLERDPLLRRAIALQGFEEQRHARLLKALTDRFGIAVSEPPVEPSHSLEHDFLFAGFGECFDSFFAFGLFRVAEQSGYFPTELVAIFEPIIQEEARHILFFVNWVKYRRMLLPWWQRPLFRLRCAWIILQHIASRVRTARSMNAPASDATAAAESRRDVTAAAEARATPTSAENFTLSAHQQLGEAITLRRLLQLCLQENERRLQPYDRRLARPRLVPTMVGAIYRLLCCWPQRPVRQQPAP